MNESRQRLFRSIAVAAAAALLLSIAGAFGTAAQPFPQRLVYWLIVMATGSLWGQMSQRLLATRPEIIERPWLHILILTILVSVPMSLFVWLTTGPFFHGELLPAASLWALVVPVVAVSAAVCTVIVLVARNRSIPAQAADSTEPVRFLERLPPRLRRGRLIAVEAEDHYLRVHTTEGSDLILMRLSDAVEELKGIEGRQTHRSWWVAKDAVRDVKRRDGRATLSLDCGVIAPVSRRYARALQEAGWY